MPSFSVSQNRGRSEVLDIYKEEFACGTIRADRSDNTLKYEIRSVKDLVERVIPHFEEVPLLSGKIRDFERFAIICKLMYEKQHLEREGFNKIVNLAFHMNPSGKRKYSEEEIKI